MAKINDAIDYASKEVMVLQSSFQGGNVSFSCTVESSSDSLESSQYSSQQDGKSLKSFKQVELMEKPLSEAKELQESIGKSLRDFYIKGLEKLPDSEKAVPKKAFESA